VAGKAQAQQFWESFSRSHCRAVLWHCGPDLQQFTDLRFAPIRERALRRRSLCVPLARRHTRAAVEVSKILLALEQGQKPLSVVLTAGNEGIRRSSSRSWKLSGRRGWGSADYARPDRVRADKAYDPRSNRTYLRRRGIKATIPVPTDRVRSRLERGSRGGRATKVRQGRPQAAARRRVRINRLKRHHAVATRYDKLAARFEATMLVAAINEWLRRAHPPTLLTARTAAGSG
jgi:hypothetical protein